MNSPRLPVTDYARQPQLYRYDNNISQPRKYKACGVQLRWLGQHERQRSGDCLRKVQSLERFHQQILLRLRHFLVDTLPAMRRRIGGGRIVLQRLRRQRFNASPRATSHNRSGIVESEGPRGAARGW
jgi:hypothetical protein